jgi:DNA-binding beta-propeller fold protein YncE
MKLFLIGFLGAALALTAQVPGASNKVAPAILGFTQGAGPAEVHPILGVFGAARIGDPLAVPETVTRLYLSSRQHYALAENSGGPLAVWGLDEADALVAITGAMPNPDLVAFSPRGEAVALYSSASRQLQVIGGMPGSPLIKKTPPLESPDTITMIAVSDDGNVVVIKDSAGNTQVSNGETGWRPIYGAYSPLAWSFIPKTHDLIVSDSVEKAVFLIEQADSKNAPIVLAEARQPDQLGVTSDGKMLVALDSKRSALWTIDLKSRVSSAITSIQNTDSIAMLRNGSAFLASSHNASPTLLKISDAAAVQTAVIHAATAPGSR